MARLPFRNPKRHTCGFLHLSILLSAADERVTDKASDAMCVRTKDNWNWFRTIERGYRVVCLDGDRDDVRTQAHDALGHGDASMSTCVSAGAQVATTSEGPPSDELTSTTFDGLGDLTPPEKPPPCSMEELMPQLMLDAFDRETKEDLLPPKEDLLPPPGTVAPSQSVCPTHVTEEDPLRPLRPDLAPVAPPVGVTQLTAVMAPESLIATNGTMEQGLSEPKLLIGPDGNVYRQTDINAWAWKVLNQQRGQSPVSVMSQLPMDEPSDTQANKRQRKNLGDSFNNAKSDISSDICIDNMPKLKGKLAYFNLTTDNVRLDNKGKVKGVNKNKNNNKFDARFAAQLQNTASADRTSFNVYIASYKNADDATVAVTLLDCNLTTTLTTNQGTMTYYQYLQKITEKESLKAAKKVLTEAIVQQVKKMNMEVVEPEIDAGALGAVSPFTFALVPTLAPIPRPAPSSYLYPGRRARCDVLGRFSCRRQRQSRTECSRRKRHAVLKRL